MHFPNKILKFKNVNINLMKYLKVVSEPAVDFKNGKHYSISDSLYIQ